MALIDAQTAEADLLAEFVGKQSEQAFAELVRRHLPMVLGVCRRVLEDDHSAQDAAQAVFLALARKAGSLEGQVPDGITAIQCMYAPEFNSHSESVELEVR